MLIYVRNSIKKGIKIGKKCDEDGFEIILKKSFFGLNEDLKVVYTYASPINSCYTKSRSVNILDKIEVDFLDDVQNHLIMGDLNGRTKIEEDFVRDIFDKHSPINEACYEKDTPLLIQRNNRDTHPVDEQGRKIIDLCKSSALKIVNGRSVGDRDGNFTRYPIRINENPSTIDYALCSTGLLQDIHNFTVIPFTALSDHCCISLDIKVKTAPLLASAGTEIDNETLVHRPTYRYSYDKRKKTLYEQNLSESKNIDVLCYTLSKGDISIGTIDKCVDNLNEIMMNAAVKTFPPKRIFLKNKKNKRNKGKINTWYTRECASKKKVFNKYSKLMSKEPFNRENLHHYIKARSDYKNTCRKAEKVYRQNLTKKLMDIGQSDPKTFWDIISKMNKWEKEQPDPSENISAKAWHTYFKKLLNDYIEPKSQNPILEPEERTTFDPTLDGRIQVQELQDALSELKCGKSPGPDGIYVECLKIFGQKYESVLLPLLRHIFANHVYPSCWTINFLKPIYKKGGVADPGNYRGLAIGSALAKLFSLILLKRLTNYMIGKKLLSPNQIGFMKGSTTSDHIFLLQTIIDKIVKRNKKKLYVAFIDFKKAYDRVNHDVLLQRLKTLGINGIFLRNIESMYKHTLYSIKLKNSYLDPISSNLGLKQGCPLSPMLFNLYIDDVMNIFDEQCDPVPVLDTFLSHFLYADDLVLLSQSRAGLQRCLDKLHQFSSKKRLSVSIDKSKTIVFNPTGKLKKDCLTLNRTNLEPVQKFCYLGFEVKASGTVKHAIDTLHDKANKAMRPLLSAISRFNIPTKTAISLFHTLIAPIMLYNAENWMTLSDKKLQTFTLGRSTFDEKSKVNTIHKKFLKHILGLNKSSPNLAVMGETGEIPLLVKGYRLMVNFWHRIRGLPDNSLVKKALVENTKMRSNWIIMIEKLLNIFEIQFTENNKLFKTKSKKNYDLKYIEYWENNLINFDAPRLHFYRYVKKSFGYEGYLDIGNFQWRKSISKLKCSSHILQIEKGRHINQPREERLCKLCNLNEIETEEHLLLRCTFYDTLRTKYDMTTNTDSNTLLTNTPANVMGQYLTDAFATRKEALENPTLNVGVGHP